MSGMNWKVRLQSSTFYSSGRAECPRCHSQFRLDAPPIMIQASDLLGDLCPVCGAFLIINMLHEVFETADVIIEAYSTVEDMETRERALIDLFEELKRWKSFPRWKRLVLKRPRPTA
jgi:hypothetical protein